MSLSLAFIFGVVLYIVICYVLWIGDGDGDEDRKEGEDWVVEWEVMISLDGLI